MGRLKLNNLPEEIMLEILSRLPTESALDSKLVCKPFRDVIRQPSFGQRHLDRLNDSTGSDDSRNKVSFVIMIYEQGLKEFYYTEFDEDNLDEILFTRKTRLNLSPAFRFCYFVGSYNGLICFNSWNHDLEYRYGPAYISNPITREYVVLPNLEGIYQWTGFGYSDSTHQYKVVRICLDSDEPNFGIAQVYTLGSGNGWRNSAKMGMKKMEHIRMCAGAFANGALHWVNKDTGDVLAFDLTDEKFSELPSPPCLARDGGLDCSTELGVLGGFLSATSHDNPNSSEIWLLRKSKDNSDYWSWRKEFIFNTYIKQSFEFMKSGRLLCHGRGNIYIYDPEEASSAKMGVSLGMSIDGAVPHRSTLVSLIALGEKNARTMEFGERARSSEVIESSA